MYAPNVSWFAAPIQLNGSAHPPNMTFVPMAVNGSSKAYSFASGSASSSQSRDPSVEMDSKPLSMDYFGIEEERAAWMRSREAEKASLLRHLASAASNANAQSMMDADESPDRVLPEWIRARLLQLMQEEDRSRSALQMAEASDRRKLMDSCLKGAQGLSHGRDIRLKELRALRLQELRNEERDLARLLIELDASDFAEERSSELMKQKLEERINLILAQYSAEGDRLRHRISAGELAWQTAARHPLTFKLVVDQEIQDEVVDRAYIEAQELQEKSLLLKLSLGALRRAHEWIVLRREEGQGRRALIWTEAQQRVLLHEKVTIFSNFMARQVPLNGGSGNVLLDPPSPSTAPHPQQPFQAPITKPHFSTHPKLQPDLRPLSTLRPEFQAQAQTTARTPLLPQAPQTGILTFPSQVSVASIVQPVPVHSPASSAYRDGLAQPHMAPEKCSISSKGHIPAISASPVWWSSNSTPRVASPRHIPTDEPVVPPLVVPQPQYLQFPASLTPGTAPATTKDKLEEHLVHVEAFVTEYVKRYLDEKGQVVEVVETQVDERCTLVPANSVPLEQRDNPQIIRLTGSNSATATDATPLDPRVYALSR